MYVIRARNVNDALPTGISQLLERGIEEPSRAGPVTVLPEPVTTVYSRPTERVLFSPLRDANPFFHLFEGLWMLAGRRDGRFLDRFVKDFSRRFSDYDGPGLNDGPFIYGAYGNRWRNWSYDQNETDTAVMDQVKTVIAYLKHNPFGRRGVIQMWNPATDLGEWELLKDVPCNLTITFCNMAGRLNMTTFSRSHDIIWGAYGANAVHFSMLQEYVAAMVGWEVGTYYQVSNNFHAYTDKLRVLAPVTSEAADISYPSPTVPMVTVPATWDRDLALFMEDPSSNGFEDPWWAAVAKPMWWAHSAFAKRSDPDRFVKAREILAQCRAADWRRAGEGWIDRRAARFTKAG